MIRRNVTSCQRPVASTPVLVVIEELGTYRKSYEREISTSHSSSSLPDKLGAHDAFPSDPLRLDRRSSCRTMVYIFGVEYEPLLSATVS